MRWLFRIPGSIQWRLPLSYAAVALVGAAVLGLVMIVILRGYYWQREHDHLASNARVMSARLRPLVERQVSAAALESQLRSLAFLSFTRVRLFDPAGGPLADSGDPRQRGEIAKLLVDVQVDGLTQGFSQQ